MSMNMMQCGPYMAKVVYDDSIDAFHGEVVNIRDTITFQATSVAGLRKAFEESVAEYVAFCKEEGVEPEKPYSGKFPVRVTPELHRKLSIAAKQKRLSLNAFVERSLEKAVNEEA